MYMSGTFRDLEVWKAAMELAVHVYRLTAMFPKEERYGLTSQMRRAAVSVPSNIAEGKGRSSDKELIQFLCHSRGSLFEIETQLEIGEQLGYSKTERLRRHPTRDSANRPDDQRFDPIRQPTLGSSLTLRRTYFRKPEAESQLPSAHGFSVGRYILIVVFDGAGEAVVALGVSDEVGVVALRRVHGGFEGAASGIADGAWW